jgi:hypothetical protein
MTTDGFHCTWVGSIFFVRWRRGVTGADTPPLLEAFRKGASPGATNSCVLSIPDNIDVPNTAGRAAAKQWLVDARPSLRSFYFVIEGDSIRQTMQRTIVGAIMFFLREQAGYLHVTGSARDALTALKLTGGDAAAVLQQARAEQAVA